MAFLIVYAIMVYTAGKWNWEPPGHWKAEIFADKSGYYAYLPATFIYGFYEPDIKEGTRYNIGGFRFENGKLIDKYPIGVAVLVMPFFLATHLIAMISGIIADGYSWIYFDMTYWASTFYFLAGVLLLFIFLRRRYQAWISIITLLVLVFGTNLYYYSAREPMMSHIYSFFLFSLLLLLTDNLWRDPKTSRFYFVAAVSSLILLVRPINIIFLPVILFLNASGWKDITARLKFIFSIKNFPGALIILLIVFLPQMIYWKFISGEFLHYSHEGETFRYWKNPKFINVLFSPMNGMMVYTPAYLMIFMGFILMFMKREQNRFLLPVIFLIVLVMVSSWHSWSFGCSYGQRPFVEYLSLFSISLASFFTFIFTRKNLKTYVISSVILGYLIYVNLSISFIYPKCYEAEPWDWRLYRSFYYKAKIFPVNKMKMISREFEEEAIDPAPQQEEESSSH